MQRRRLSLKKQLLKFYIMELFSNENCFYVKENVWKEYFAYPIFQT